MNNIIILFFIVIVLYLLKKWEEYDIEENFNKIDNNKSNFEGNELFVYNKISKNDNSYFNKFLNYKMTSLLNNNKLKTPNTKKNKILFVTFDNREKEYIRIHNENLTKYAKKWNYSYKFINECPYNVYWCKIQIVIDELKTNKYDYVVWLDSDSAIKNPTIDINDIINKYSSDIFVGCDNIRTYDLINAGVFIIKNSDIGKNFLQDCINNVTLDCFNPNGSLKGIWAASCYEQGQMNLLIAEKYSENTTVLPNEIILNFGKCYDNTFIMHLYGGSDDERIKCLSKLQKDF